MHACADGHWGMCRWYGQRVGEWLRLAPLQRLMVALPPWVEGWRERLRLGQDLFRGIRRVWGGGRRWSGFEELCAWDNWAFI